MKTSVKCKVQSANRWKYLFLLVAFLLLTAHGLLLTASFATEKWPGVDETVVEKLAQEHGRAARTPLINTDQGDLLLFVFLLAGAVGGFIGGYYWRILTENGTKIKELRTKKKEGTYHA